MKSTGKWMDLEVIILREVTQTQKTNTECPLSYVMASCESLDMCV